MKLFVFAPVDTKCSQCGNPHANKKIIDGSEVWICNPCQKKKEEPTESPWICSECEQELDEGIYGYECHWCKIIIGYPEQETKKDE